VKDLDISSPRFNATSFKSHVEPEHIKQHTCAVNTLAHQAARFAT